ncbi:MAG: hypothetical protein AABX35_00930 [Nanoarchaeota archaeon]
MKLTKKVLKEIDKPIRELIILLNEHGFITTYCCAGHPMKDRKRKPSDLDWSIQEHMLNYCKQFNIDLLGHWLRFRFRGYISFKTKRQLREVYALIKKTSQAKKFYLNDKDKGYNFLELRLKKGTSRENYNKVWKRLAKELRLILCNK